MSRRVRRWPAVVGALLLGAGLAGCAGSTPSGAATGASEGGTSPTVATTPLTTTQASAPTSPAATTSPTVLTAPEPSLSAGRATATATRSSGPVTSGAATSGAARPASPRPSAAVPSGPLLVLRRTGGFAGVQDDLRVERSGAWEATRRGGTTTSGRLPDASRRSLQALVSGSAWSREGAQTPRGGCADGFGYTITAAGRTVTTDDCLLGAQPTLSRLVETAVAATGL